MSNLKPAVIHIFTANSPEEMVAHDPAIGSVARFFTFPSHFCEQNTFEEDGTPLMEKKWLNDDNYKNCIGVVVDHVQQHPATESQMQTLKAFAKKVMEEGQPREFTEELHKLIEQIDSIHADGISQYAADKLIKETKKF